MGEEKFLPEEIESSEKNNFKRFFSVRRLAILFLVFLFLNVIYIDILLVQGSNKQTIVQRFTNIINQTAPKEGKTAVPADICPQSCVSQIQQAMSSANPTATPASNAAGATPAPTTNTSSQITNPSQTKEYYIPFGSGSGSSADWQDVPGLQANVDSNSYGSIKSVVFEASLHIPTGNETASVRLYNTTDAHAVWNSEVNFSSNTSSVLLVSSNITLDSGNKLYKVQMKTQLQFQAILDQSRLHITTK